MNFRRIYSDISIVAVFWFIFLPNPALKAQQSWSKQLPGVGTFSSPRVTDLTGDGTGDIILGIGRKEFQACDSAIIALDGKNGEILWKVPSPDQIFGSATLKDITGDGIQDVFISGRSAELKAINGKTGEVIWSFVEVNKPKKGKKREWYNFYNPQFVPDQDGDGMEDILVSNGGDVLAEPYDPNRPSGILAIINSMNGIVLSKAYVPDGKETYMSVSQVKSEDGNDRKVIFGTGGETLGGHLYVTQLSDIMNGDISGAIKLDSSAAKGFIGPPAWVDITGDGFPDIISNAVDGRLLAYDGSTNENIWKVNMPGTEAYSSIAVGNFNKDTIPDFFVSYAQGVWPKLDWTKQFMVNGKNGAIEYTDSLGFYQTSTPVVADFNLDGVDDALVVVNYQVVDDFYRKWFYNMLVVIDFVRNDVIDLGINHDGHNLSSTPWIGDMDGNGLIDIIYCHSTNVKHTYAFDGMQINRIVTSIPIQEPIKWGAYMGSNYDGVYKK